MATVARRSFGRNVVRTALAVALVTVVLFAGGFFLFAERVAQLPQPDNPSADAIVVLTGGAARIDWALNLLAENRAKRLLISGVHPSTTVATLQKRTGREKELFNCCVDIDHEALDTIGNAQEARKWVAANRFSSLILVTSAYHMPRSIKELSAALPETEIIGFPVVSDNMSGDHWWSAAGTARVLFGEYVKFVAASLRLTMRASESDPASSAALAGSAGTQ